MGDVPAVCCIGFHVGGIAGVSILGLLERMLVAGEAAFGEDAGVGIASSTETSGRPLEIPAIEASGNDKEEIVSGPRELPLTGSYNPG